MTYMHYADREVILDRTRVYEQPLPVLYQKPRGFWFSVVGEDDWEQWCRSEEFAIGSLEHRHEITLVTTAHILRIATSEELVAFHRAYAIETDYERRYSQPFPRWPIDWWPVARRYDGIEIAPYQWSQRFPMPWYYGWDCASGCIWNLDAIDAVTSVAEPAVEAT